MPESEADEPSLDVEVPAGVGRSGGSIRGAVAVRSVRPEDAEPLALAHVRAWQAGYRGLMPQQYLDGLDIAERANEWRRLLDVPRERPRMLVATVDDRVVGFVTFGRARDSESGDDGELYAINVHPDHWGSGAGSALLVQAQQGLTDLGHRQAVLWVVPGNERARRFYERHGWAVEQVQRNTVVQGATVSQVRYARSLP